MAVPPLTPAPIPEGAPKPDLSPEARRRKALRWHDGLAEIEIRVGPGTRIFIVAKRVFIGVFQDGFIHAGNLAYMGMLALFPFFITVGAAFAALGQGAESANSVDAFLSALPRVVRHSLAPVAHEVIIARHGWLLWAGGVIGLWTVSSLIETIRDILHRAYGVASTTAFWRYRLLSSAFIVLAVICLLGSLFAQVAISAAQQVIIAGFPGLDAWVIKLAFGRLVPAVVLYASIYLLFFSLTPSAYRKRRYPKWPGALLVTLWWVLVSVALPLLLRFIFKYDLTYGNLAGVMIALFFFWLVGLGMVTGAELNAALAETPEERDMLGQTDNRRRAERN
jgi:membrane protein